MERLTEYESIGGHAHAIITCDLDKAIMRLAAYENVGLEPEEVISMQGEWCAMMAALNSIGGGYGRLRELAEADKDGRLVVHGWWESVDSSYWRWTSSNAVSVSHTTYRCGRCGWGTVVKTNYCPNCGAKMDIKDGGDNDAAD